MKKQGIDEKTRNRAKRVEDSGRGRDFIPEEKAENKLARRRKRYTEGGRGALAIALLRKKKGNKPAERVKK